MRRDRPIVVNRNRRCRVSRNPLYDMRIRDLPEGEMIRTIHEHVERHNRVIDGLLRAVRWSERPC